MYLWRVGGMAAERLQFHEMGLDDRLLKVMNRLGMPVNLTQTFFEAMTRQLNRKKSSETQH